MTSKDVEYYVDGTLMVGHLAIPSGTTKRPAVLIAHGGRGLTDHPRHCADRLAELGYVAFALDYHGGGQTIADPHEVQARLEKLWFDPDRTRSIATAGLTEMLAVNTADPSKVAAIGYCFGGAIVLELARGGADVKAVVGFHPNLTTRKPQDAKNIVGKILACVGTEDPLISIEDRSAFESEMRAASVDWRMNLYGGAQHSFTDPAADGLAIPGLSYNAVADERSWRAMLDLFDEVFAENG